MILQRISQVWGCPKYDTPTQPTVAKHYCVNVKRFNLNLLLWVRRRFALTTTNFKTKLLWGRYSWSLKYPVIRPKYHDFDHFILNGLVSHKSTDETVCDVYYCMLLYS